MPLDLSLIGDAAEAFDRLYEYAGMLYEQIPVRFNMFCNFLIYSEKYGLGGADMVDIGSFLYNTDAIGVLVNIPGSESSLSAVQSNLSAQ